MNSINIGRCSGAFMLAAAVTLAGCGSSGDKSASAGGAAIRVAGGDGATAATPFFAALQQGFFKDAGLDVSYVTLAGGSTSMDAALVSKEVDVGIGAGSQWMSDVAKGAISGKIIGEIADNNYVILGGKGITDPAQLKGKMFGVSNYNAGDHLYAKSVMMHFGVGPEDVVWLAVGSPAGRLAALKAGKVSAIQMPLTNLPASEVGSILVGAENSPSPFVSNALFARQEFLDANRPALKKFVAAIGRGSDWVKAHPKEAIPACLESGATPEACKTAIESAGKSKNPYTWSHSAAVNMQAIDAMLPMVAQVVPQAKNLKPADIVDSSIAGSKP